MAEVSPTAAIALAWGMIENSLAEAFSKMSGQTPSNSAIENARRLSDTGRIKKEWFGIIEKMQRLRNVLVHGEHPEVSLTNVKRYADLARRVIAQVQRAQ